jgi:cephalosporin hydroxylase
VSYYDLIGRHAPSQSPWELNELLTCLDARAAVRTVLEIGVHQGGSLRVWLAALRPRCCVGVNWSDEITGETAGLTLLLGKPSQDPDTVRAVRELCPAIEFLFIDAGHSYDEVAADYRNYGPLVAAGGAIAFHDVELEDGVRRLWSELRVGRKTTMIWDGAGSGTGVLWL